MLYNIRTNWGVKMEGLSMRRPPLEYSMDTERNMLTRRDNLIITDNFSFRDTIRLSILSFDRLCISQIY